MAGPYKIKLSNNNNRVRLWLSHTTDSRVVLVSPQTCDFLLSGLAARDNLRLASYPQSVFTTSSLGTLDYRRIEINDYPNNVFIFAYILYLAYILKPPVYLRTTLSTRQGSTLRVSKRVIVTPAVYPRFLYEAISVSSVDFFHPLAFSLFVISICC